MWKCLLLLAIVISTAGIAEHLNPNSPPPGPPPAPQPEAREALERKHSADHEYIRSLRKVPIENSAGVTTRPKGRIEYPFGLADYDHPDNPGYVWLSVYDSFETKNIVSYHRQPFLVPAGVNGNPAFQFITRSTYDMGSATLNFFEDGVLGATTAGHVIIHALNQSEDKTVDEENQIITGHIWIYTTNFGYIRVFVTYNKRGRIEDAATFTWKGTSTNDVPVVPISERDVELGETVYVGIVQHGNAGLYEAKADEEWEDGFLEQDPSRVVRGCLLDVYHGKGLVSCGDSGGPLLVKNDDDEFEQVGVLSSKDGIPNSNEEFQTIYSTYATHQSMGLIRRVFQRLRERRVQRMLRNEDRLLRPLHWGKRP